MKSVRTQNKID